MQYKTFVYSLQFTGEKLQKNVDIEYPGNTTPAIPRIGEKVTFTEGTFEVKDVEYTILKNQKSGDDAPVLVKITLG